MAESSRSTRTLAVAPDAPGDPSGPHSSSAEWSFRRDGHCIIPNDRPFAIEVFAGSARLTKALRSQGLDAWGVDWKGGKLMAETPAILMLNLTVAAGVQVFRRLLQHPRLVYV